MQIRNKSENAFFFIPVFKIKLGKVHIYLANLCFSENELLLIKDIFRKLSWSGLGRHHIRLYVEMINYYTDFKERLIINMKSRLIY